MGTLARSFNERSAVLSTASLGARFAERNIHAETLSIRHKGTHASPGDGTRDRDSVGLLERGRERVGRRGAESSALGERIRHVVYDQSSAGPRRPDELATAAGAHREEGRGRLSRSRDM
jgi:hypothetical protein